MATSNRPSLVIIGGGLRYDHQVIFDKIIELAGGKGAKIAVFPTASRHPYKVGGYAMNALKKYGADPIFIPLANSNIDVDYQTAVNDPDLIEQVRDCTGIYFTGGEQHRITEILLTDQGDRTAMLEAIWQVYEQGGVIAGTSAGAAMMSTTMFTATRSNLEILKQGVDGTIIGKGLGFIGGDIFIDQHFFKRARFARSIVLMNTVGYQWGIGVDEDTAIVVQDEQLEVIGYQGVLLMDLSISSMNHHIHDFNIKNVKLSYLGKGDQLNLKTMKTTPNELKQKGAKLMPDSADYYPYHNKYEFYPDVLANSILIDILFNLIDNKYRQFIGLAFTHNPDHESDDLGFEFVFRKGEGTRGYYTGAFGSDDYTIINMYLDVNPIKIQQPLYTKI